MRNTLETKLGVFFALTLIVAVIILELVGVADRMAMMSEGKIIALGTPDEVRRSPDPLVQKFLTVDFKPQPTVAAEPAGAL